MPLSKETVKNSIKAGLRPNDVKNSSMDQSDGAKNKRLGNNIAARRFLDQITPSQLGRFIWQLVGVLATYDSMYLTGAKV